MSETATVETITAEVRTLMVGSRQITASVYGQLDRRTNSEDIVPFGRVTPKNAEPGWVHIVGKDTATGELVRAETPTTEYLIRAVVGQASKARNWENAAANFNQKASKYDKEADEAAAAAERELTGSYSSAATYDDAAAKAATAELEAATKLDQLKARKEAADAIWRAETCREKAREFQAKAEAAREQANRHQADADDAEMKAEAWDRSDAAEIERLSDLALAWSRLPLIVLAGLR